MEGKIKDLSALKNCTLILFGGSDSDKHAFYSVKDRCKPLIFKVYSSDSQTFINYIVNDSNVTYKVTPVIMLTNQVYWSRFLGTINDACYYGPFTEQGIISFVNKVSTMVTYATFDDIKEYKDEMKKMNIVVEDPFGIFM